MADRIRYAEVLRDLGNLLDGEPGRIVPAPHVVPLLRALADLCEKAEKAVNGISPAPWMRNGRTVQNLWRIDDADPQRVGIAFLMTPCALVRRQEDADFIKEASHILPDLADGFIPFSPSSVPSLAPPRGTA